MPAGLNSLLRLEVIYVKDRLPYLLWNQCPQKVCRFPALPLLTGVLPAIGPTLLYLHKWL